MTFVSIKFNKIIPDTSEELKICPVASLSFIREFELFRFEYYGQNNRKVLWWE